MRHVHQVLGGEVAGLEEVRVIEGVAGDLDVVWMEELDPFAVGRFGDLAGIAAVAGEEVEVLGQVEVDGPLVALHVVGGALAGGEVVAGEVEVLALDGLPVVPDGLAVEAPELVPGDLHGDAAFVDERVVGAVGVDHPDAVDFLPGAFVAVHQQRGVLGREEHVADPVGGVEEHGELAGLEVDGVERERRAGGEALLHHLALVGGLDERAGGDHAGRVDAVGAVLGGCWGRR